ncbi:hypothetical protein Alg130_10884 [Pyrenophora tritici-repentis]|nr:hypothetical protein Alg130_10884 [Pyrenophora tritici-repentis]
MTDDVQRQLLQAWASDVGHVVGVGSPKAEFARLAKAKGWAGGDEEWCRHWKMCFSEVYPYGNNDLAEDLGALTLSRASSYSVISASDDSLADVRSLNSERSEPAIIPGISLNAINSRSRRSSIDSIVSINTVLSNATVQSLEEFSGAETGVGYGEGVSLSAENNNSNNSGRDGVAQTLNLCIRQRTRRTSDVPAAASAASPSLLNPAWNAWPNFTPDASATFKAEFKRLAATQGWSNKDRHAQLRSLLTSEVSFWWNANGDKLAQWRQLCEDMGFKEDFRTIKQCKNALKPLKVNLYSVVNHKRNPIYPIVTYKTRNALRSYVLHLALVLRYPRSGNSLIDRFIRTNSAGASNESHGRRVGFQSYSTVVDRNIGAAPDVKSQKPAEKASSMGSAKGKAQLESSKKKATPQKASSSGSGKAKNRLEQDKKKAEPQKESSKSSKKGATPPGSNKKANPQNPSSGSSKKGKTPPASNKKKANPQNASSTSSKKSRSPKNLARWRHFKGFTPESDKSFSEEFSRLAQRCKWDKEDRKKYRILLFDPEFDGHSNDASSLESWQLLCRLCSINPVPDSIPKCMNALDSILVNIYKVENAKDTGKPHIPFETFEEFRNHTMENGNRYPLEKAKKDEQKKIFLKRLNGDATQ